MKHPHRIKFSPRIEAEIGRMARAGFRSYKNELRRLLKRGLGAPSGCTTADEVRATAELAYLRAQQVEESTEGCLPRVRARGFSNGASRRGGRRDGGRGIFLRKINGIWDVLRHRLVR